jgi:hypothetical protein
MPIARIVMMYIVFVHVPAMPYMVIVVIAVMVITVGVHDLDAGRADNDSAWRSGSANFAAPDK